VARGTASGAGGVIILRHRQRAGVQRTKRPSIDLAANCVKAGVRQWRSSSLRREHEWSLSHRRQDKMPMM